MSRCAVPSKKMTRSDRSGTDGVVSWGEWRVSDHPVRSVKEASRLAMTCILLILFSCAKPQEKTTIQMAVGGQTQFIYLPLTLADRLGYFKDEGLTVNISDLRGGSEALAAMMGGSVDMVTGFYEHTIRARAQGQHLVMVVLFDRYPGLVLMVGKHHFTQVHTIKDLVGEPVSVT